MSGVIVQNMPLKKGKTLTVTGIPQINCNRFNLNVGNSDTELALHMDCRFNHYGDKNTIVCNSCYRGQWGKEQRIHIFPFAGGVIYKIDVSFTGNEFEITLQNGFKFQFPNRLAADKYNYLEFAGQAQIQGIEIK